jgi:hypothetical protein
MIRKTTLLCISLFFLQGILIAQKTEFSVNLNSGFHHFNGENYPGVMIVTMMPEPDIFPYGSPGEKSGFSYELSLQAQRVTKKKIIYGFELGYQSLQSKRAITGVTASIYSNYMAVANGSAKVTGTFIDIAPFAGYRFQYKQVTIDLKTGPEYAPCIERKQKINATYPGSSDEIVSERSLSNKRADLRIRGQVVVSYKKIGINAGYSYGLTNFYNNDVFGHPQYHSRFVRLGLNYRIK